MLLGDKLQFNRTDIDDIRINQFVRFFGGSFIVYLGFRETVEITEKITITGSADGGGCLADCPALDHDIGGRGSSDFR